MRDRTKEIISDDEIYKVFTGTNFGSTSPRDVTRYSLLKYASGYRTGSTACACLKELGLIKTIKKGVVLTRRGKEYLYESFCNGNSL